MLKIKNLKASLNQKAILNGINLDIKKAETHVLMGQNGAGKSTLAQIIMGNPEYEASGKLKFLGKDISDLDAQKRATMGIFLSFQQILEIPGVRVYDYLKLLYKKSHSKKLSPLKFKKFLAEKMDSLKMDEKFIDRSLNHGFSGGEKRKMEALQMLVIEPKLIILDEIDSGLDVDALKVVFKAVKQLQEKNNSSLLLISHYPKLLDYLKVDKTHLLENGKIIKSSDSSLIKEIENKGFQTK